MHTSNYSPDSALSPQRFSASGLRYLLRFFFAATLMLSAAATFGATNGGSLSDLAQAATDARNKAGSPGATPADKIAAAKALAACASADPNPLHASEYAWEAAQFIADKTVANSDPAAAAQVAATITQVVSNPVVAATYPAKAAGVATIATYVVNLPSVAASDPTAVASVAANVAIISSLSVVSSNGSNASLAADLAKAKADGQADVNVTVQITTTPGLPLHKDITIVSASS
jgi:hypothetical protein